MALTLAPGRRVSKSMFAHTQFGLIATGFGLVMLAFMYSRCAVAAQSASDRMATEPAALRVRGVIDTAGKCDCPLETARDALRRNWPWPHEPRT